MDLQYSWACTAWYLRNPSTDLIFLLHMERTYIGVVQWGLILFFFPWNWNICKNWNLWHVTSDFYVYTFVLPQCLTVFYSTVMW